MITTVQHELQNAIDRITLVINHEPQDNNCQACQNALREAILALNRINRQMNQEMAELQLY